MGQRLNIEIIENGKVLANAYYHWSAYTSSSLIITQEILKSINDNMYEDKVVRAIKLLEVTGAGLTAQEKQFAKDTIKDFYSYIFAECTGRDDGLIAISEQGIEETRLWEEGRVEIDIAKQTVNFNVLRIKTIEKEKEENSDFNYEQLPVFEGDFNNIPFAKFAEFKKQIHGLIASKIYKVRLKNDDKVYGFIEVFSGNPTILMH